MASICSSPPEIQLMILNYCDFFSLLQMRQVSKYCKLLADHSLLHQCHLHVVCDYLAKFLNYKHPSFALSDQRKDYDLVFNKIFEFINFYMPNLQDLSLRNCPVILTVAGLIQLASAAPNLYRLDLSQTCCNKPFFEADAILALRYFRQLKVLVMDGFVLQKASRKG
uniref:F-box domain-containing protein n=1 Tax=Setaria digitata TaxID=48799 RepID=A0A915PHF3_9BILA